MNLTVDHIVKLGLVVAFKLDDANIPTVDVDDVDALIRACFKNDDVGFTLKRALPKGSNDSTKAFFSALKFHMGSNMNLHGPIMHATILGHDAWDRLDTFAHALCMVLNGKSRGVAAWAQALGTTK